MSDPPSRCRVKGCPWVWLYRDYELCPDHARAVQWERYVDRNRHANFETAPQERVKRAVEPAELEAVPARR